MCKSLNLTFLVAATLAFGHFAQACGPWLPNRLLDQGGKMILDAPEFYFELELKEIAKDYRTPFQAITRKIDGSVEDTTVTADLADFRESGKAGAPLHEAMRRYLSNPANTDPIPPFRAENDEFTLYHRGALALKQQKLEEAQAAWLTLLDLPANQRPYRSTWAAFMLGKIHLTSDPAAAKSWFQKTRFLTADGCKDSLGLASESLGWEARVELDAGKYEAAAPLYLNHLASGDLSAVNSAKQLCGDAYPDEQFPRFAADPLLRRITTAHLLGQFTQSYCDQENSSLKSWLSAVDAAKISTMSEADRLGWLAYTAGRYDEAKQWLEKVPSPTGLSLWLEAKLDFRAGNIAKAQTAMAKAVRLIPTEQELETYEPEYNQIMPNIVASGDLGMLQLARSEFTAAFQTFLDGGHWQDAAYLAERIFTTQELTKLLAEHFPWTEAQDETVTREDNRRDEVGDLEHNTRKLRWLLARRLARNEKFTEARPYFPAEYRPALDEYAVELKKGRSEKNAAALWKAAQIARNQGMELLGTENEPDALLWDGAFEQTNVAGEREQGKYLKFDYTDEGEKRSNQPLILPASRAERKLLAAHRVEPEKRFHYRYIAANLAWQAAKWMPDEDEQTATVLNTAGNWLKNRDEVAADRFLQAIERRCPNTPTGREVLKKHWFIDPPSG